MISEDVWAAMLEAEDSRGEGAEDFAVAHAAAARAIGDMEQAIIWDQAAAELHILHRINRKWARPRSTPLGGNPGASA